MTPHELLRHVPKTNCGTCGFSTCLAYAVAVTRGGADASLCPYLKPEALPDLGLNVTGGGGLARVDNLGQERDLALVTHLQGKVRPLDFHAIAPLLGALWHPGRPDRLNFSYLGQEVELGKEGVLLAGAPLVDPRDQILLYNYIASGGGPAPVGEWLGLESLPNSISKVRTLDVYCESRLADHFRGRGEKLLHGCRQLGGRAGEAQGGAVVSWVVPVLPHVPQMLLFWDEEPEDGFEARVKVLFDRRVMTFLDLESLVFSAERMAERLCSLSTT